jgi:hypothetical protein
MSDVPQLQHRKLEGRVESDEALDEVLAQAQRTLRLFDRRLGSAFDTVRRQELLGGFLRASRANRIRIVLHDASNLSRECPRLIGLLRSFSHAIAIQETQEQAKGVYDPFCIADDHHYLHRFHYDDTRALLALNDPQGAYTLVQRFEEIWEASTPAVSATTLGL